MVPVMSLWVPILVSGVIVFMASSLIHMFLGYHRADYRKLAKEDEVMEALRKFDIPPGDYMVPRAGSPAAMKDPAFLEKRTQGPVGLMTFMKPGAFDMGPSLMQWFVYCLVVSVFAAYLTGRAFGAGADYRPVFRFAATTAFVGYALALWQESIWHKRQLSTTLRGTFDGLVYGLLTGGTFGWLWPK